MNAHSYNIIMKKLHYSDKTILKVEKLFSIIADETRLKIMRSLLSKDCAHECAEECGMCKHLHCMGEKCVNDIVNEVGASQSLVSHQLKVLKDANLVKTRKEGQKVFYSLNDGHVRALLSIAIEHVEEDKNV